MTDDTRPTVLVVDDDPLVRRALERLLVRMNVQVFIYERSFGLLNRIAELRPTLVLLDVNMPGLDGAALTTLIRNDKQIARTRVVLHSALDGESLSRRARECGADGFLVKSPGLAGVMDAVSRWVHTPALMEAATSRLAQRA